MLDIKANLSRARLNRSEIAGSLGDLGTFLPLLIGMAAANGLDFAAGLFFAGLFSVVTGLLFSVPMAVQPMKAIAAIAIAQGLSVPEVLAAGVGVSIVVVFLGTTGLIDALNRAVPRSVVRGIQLAAGLSLLMKGVQMALGTGVLVGPDSNLTAALAAIVVIMLVLSRRVPAALVLFVAGIGLAIWKNPGLPGTLGLEPWLPSFNAPGWHDIVSAFPKAALPQIPLTTLNSVIAVCALSGGLFPDRPIGPRRVALSVGAMNLVGAWFGAMPMCHGAGGLAAQYRFGARTNGSILFLGVVKMALALTLGTSLMAWCVAFPASILGVMLVFSGAELAVVVRDQTRRSDALTMLITAGASLGLSNIAIGFAIGLAFSACLRLVLARSKNASDWS